ncbi:MAG: hypothetical protein ACP5OA_03505 [Candidatus Woesearchaeota archaeon]
MRNKGDTNAYNQEQYTPFALESSATVKQTQSVKVNPEIYLISREDVANVDSLFNAMLDRIDSTFFNQSDKEEIRKGERREAKAYLFLLPTVLLLSAIGLWLGDRVENRSLTWLCVIAFEIALLTLFLKVPVLLSVM